MVMPIDVEAYIRLMEDHQFVVPLTVTKSVLSHLGPVTKALQAIAYNLADACEEVVQTKEEERGESIGISITKLWMAITQRHRHLQMLVLEQQSASEYYQVNVYSPSSTM